MIIFYACNSPFFYALHFNVPQRITRHGLVRLIWFLNPWGNFGFVWRGSCQCWGWRGKVLMDLFLHHLLVTLVHYISLWFGSLNKCKGLHISSDIWLFACPIGDSISQTVDHTMSKGVQTRHLLKLKKKKKKRQKPHQIKGYIRIKTYSCMDIYSFNKQTSGRLAQSVERRSNKPTVMGSIPISTISFYDKSIIIIILLPVAKYQSG